MKNPITSLPPETELEAQLYSIIIYVIVVTLSLVTIVNICVNLDQKSVHYLLNLIVLAVGFVNMLFAIYVLNYKINYVLNNYQLKEKSHESIDKKD